VTSPRAGRDRSTQKETGWKSRAKWKRGREVGVVRTEVGLAETSSVVFRTATASRACCWLYAKCLPNTTEIWPTTDYTLFRPCTIGCV